MTNDTLTICPKCGSDGCYKTPLNETQFSYYDFGCGFQTNDLMKEGEFDFEKYEETLPELYKALKYIDENKRVWYPISVNIAEKGTVFANGNSVDNWQWSAIKSIEVLEEESAKYKGAKYRSDAKSLSHFGNDFIEACDYIGVFDH